MAEDLTDAFVTRITERQRQEFRTWMQTQLGPPQPVALDTPEAIRTRLTELAPEHGVDPALAVAVAQVESNFNPKARSPVGAQGVMQLMPATAKRFQVADPWDPEQNMQGGLRYLAYLQRLYPNDPVRVLAAYNAGEGAVQRYGGVPPYKETQAYVQKVQAALGQAQAEASQGGRPGEIRLSGPTTGAEMQAPEQLRGRPDRQPFTAPPTTEPERFTPTPAPFRLSQETIRAAQQLPTPTAVTLGQPPTPEETEALVTQLQTIPLERAPERPQLPQPLVSFDRSGQALLGGGVSAVTNIARSPLALGVIDEQSPAGQALRKLTQPLADVQQALELRDPTVVDQAFSALGSSLVSLVPAVGVAKTLQLGAGVSRLVGLSGPAVSATLEAAQEASEAYEPLRQLVGDAEAQQRAVGVFWKNVGLIALTDRLGIFNKGLRPAIRAVNGALMEGLQETVQYDIQRHAFWVPGDHPAADRLMRQGWSHDQATGRVEMPYTPKDALTAAVLGTVLGGGMGLVLGQAGQAPEAFQEAVLDHAQPEVAAHVRERMQQGDYGPLLALTMRVRGALAGEVGGLDFSALFGTRAQVEQRLSETQVRTEEGTPKRVYHGTTAAFEQFDVQRADPTGLYGPGLYFTESPEIAGGVPERPGRHGAPTAPLGYATAAPPRPHGHFPSREAAEQYVAQHPTPDAFLITTDRLTGRWIVTEGGGTPNVRPAYLDIRRPFDIDAPADAEVREALADAIRPALSREGVALPLAPEEEALLGTGRLVPEAAEFDAAEARILEATTNEDVYGTLTEIFGDKAAVNRFLQAQGFDGITHIGGAITGTAPHRVWIAFSPEQVIPAPAYEGAPGVLDLLRDERGAINLGARFGRGGPPTLRQAAQQPDPQQDPAVQQAYQRLFDIADTLAGRVETQRRGVRHREAVHAEAAAQIQAGQWTSDDVRAIFPGTTLNDTQTSALVQHLTALGRQVQQANADFQASGAQIGSPEFQRLVQLLAVYGELSPARLGVLAESGRSLGILNDPLSGMNAYLNQLDAAIKKAPEQTMEELSRNIARITDPVALSRTLTQAARQGSIFSELFYANLLSSSKTFQAMLFDNTLQAAFAIPERFVAGVVGLRPGGEVYMGEAAAMIWALPHAFMNGMRRGLHALRTAEALPGPTGETASKFEVTERRAITAERFGLDPERPLGKFFDFWWEWIGLGTGGRLPMRLALTLDETAKGFNYDLALHALAYREAANQQVPMAERGRFIADFVADAPPEAKAQADQEAIARVLQQEMTPGGWGEWMMQVRQKTVPLPVIPGVWWWHAPAGVMVVPFVKIGVNTAKVVQRMTPIGLASQAWWQEVGAGGARADLALGKMAFGSMLLTAIAAMVGQGQFLGRGPEDKALREAGRWDERQYTWHPYGDVYIPYRRWGVLGMLIGMVADTAQLAGETDEWTLGTAAVGIYHVLSRNLLSQTFFETVARFFDSVSLRSGQRLESMGQGIERFFQSLARQAVPASWAMLQRAVDPVQREVEGILDGAYAKIAGWSDNYPARRNLSAEKRLLGWGADQTWLTRLGNAASLLEMREVTLQPYQEEMVKHQMSIGLPGRVLATHAPEAGQQAPEPAGYGKLPGLRLNDQQYERYQVFAAANRKELAELGLKYDTRTLQELTRQVGRLAGAVPPKRELELGEALNWLSTTRAYQRESDGPLGGKELLYATVVNAYFEAGKQHLLASDEELAGRYGDATRLRMLQRLPSEQRPRAEEQIRRGQVREQEYRRQLQIR